MLADELYLAMLEVGHAARRHKIPGPLAHTMIDIAQVARALAAGLTGSHTVRRRGAGWPDQPPGNNGTAS